MRSSPSRSQTPPKTRPSRHSNTTAAACAATAPARRRRRASAANSLTSVAQTLRIDDNPQLASIDHAFASLTTCGSLQLTELPKLQRVPADAFASLAEVKGNVAGPSDVWLGYCDKLMSIDAGAFPKLCLVSGDVWLLFSPDLASVAGSFPALSRVDGPTASCTCTASTRSKRSTAFSRRSRPQAGFRSPTRAR